MNTQHVHIFPLAKHEGVNRTDDSLQNSPSQL